MLHRVLAHVHASWSEREPGLQKNKPGVWVRSIFRVEFPQTIRMMWLFSYFTLVDFTRRISA